MECYDLVLDTWRPVSEMSVCRNGVDVGVMDGVMYAIGGYDGTVHIKSLEVHRPSDGVWYSVATTQSPTLGPLRHCQNVEFMVE